MTVRSRRGVSVIEALVVVVIGSAIAIVVLGLMNFSTKSFGRAAQRLDPRQAAQGVMLTLRQHLTDAKRYRVRKGNSKLMFTAPRAIGTVEFDPQAGTLTVTKDDGPKPEVIARGLRSVQFHQLRRGMLRVSLEIDRAEVQDGLASLGPLKMVDEIYCHAAARNRMIPFKRTYERRGRRKRGPEAYVAD